MSLILCTKNDIILASGLKFLIVSKEFSKEKSSFLIEVDLPAPIHYKKDPENQTKDADKSSHEDQSTSSVLGGSISLDFSMMALIDSRKQLTLWSCSDWKLQRQWPLARRPIKTVFTPDGTKLLVADKGGDVILFDTKSAEDGVCLLGHLSMLLDLVFSNCGKFVLTCDRDEKIRQGLERIETKLVSRFPNSYNINNFCLGHTEFVTALSICPHNENILISTSGDGTVKTWNFLDGLELCSCACIEYLGEDVKFEDDMVPAVTSIKCSKIGPETSTVVVTVNGYNGFLIFTLSGRDGNLIFKHRMSTKGPIRDFTFDHSSSPEKLYILDLLEDGRLKIYNATEDGLSRSELEISLEDERKIEDFVAKSQNFPAFHIKELYKKWFDNMSEYIQRKEQRIQNEKCQKSGLELTEDKVDIDIKAKRIKM